MIPNGRFPSPILLRRIKGRFDACRGFGITMAPTMLTPATLLQTAGVLVAVLLLPLALLGLAALALAHHPSSGLLLATAPVAIDAKALRDEIMNAFETFKKSNDERLAEAEKKGAASADVIQNVEKANKAITDLTAKLAEVEKIAARPVINPEPSKEVRAEMDRAREFLALTTGRDIESIKVGDEEIKATREYAKGFRAYLRRGTIENAMSVGSNPEGGYWVSPDTTGRIETLIRETSPMRSIATVETISSDAYEGGTDLDEADAGWVGETDTRSGNTSTPQIGKWRIPVHEIYAEPRATQKMLDDSIRDPEAWLAGKAADKISRTENAAFVTGNGVAKPRGFITYAHASAPTAANWQRIQYKSTGKSADFADTAPGDAIIDLIHALKAPYRQGAVFTANSLTIAEVRKLKDGNGNYLFQPNFTNGYQALVSGFPIIDFPDMADIAADSYSLAFGNFKAGYQIVDRLGIRVLRDPLTLKGWVKFYTTKRVGGDVTNFEAIKLLKFAA